MWSRIELKENAKSVLKRTYWLSFAVCLIVTLLSSVSQSNSILTNYETLMQIRFHVILTIGVSIFSFIYSTFISDPLQVGQNDFFMTSRSYDASLGRIFSAFSGSRYMKTVVTMFVMRLFVFLWSLLLIIPGIVKSYEYFFIPYIMAENPDIPRKRVFEISKLMTNGQKMNIFLLQLSFIGWILLGMLACMVGIYFVVPYINATNAELYAAQKAYVLDMGWVTEEELCGFHNN